MFSYTGILIGFVYLIFLLPAALSKEELGLTRFLLSMAILLGALFPIGISNFTLRFFPQFRDAKSGHHGFLRLTLLFALGGFVLMVVVLFMLRGLLAEWYSGTPAIVEYGYLVLPMSFSIGMFTVLNTYCMSLFKSAAGAFLNDVLIRIVLLIIALLHLSGLTSFEVFLHASATSYLLQLLILLFYVLKIDNGLQHSIDWNFIRANNPKNFLTYLAYIAPATLASMALRQIDTALLGSDIAGSNALEGVAIFTVAYTLTVLIDTPATSLARISDAKISDAIHRNDLKFVARAYHSSVRLLAVIGGLLYVGILINLDNLWLIMPDDYSSGTTVVYILGLSAFVNMATGINGSLLALSAHYRKVAWLLVAFVVLALVLNLMLIPALGITGAAIAGAGSYISYNICKSWIVWREFGVQPLDSSLVIVSVLMVSCYFMNEMIPTVSNVYLDSAMRSAIILVLYGLVCYRTGLVPELPQIMETIKKRLGIRKRI